jgi:hypothetical protein
MVTNEDCFNMLKSHMKPDFLRMNIHECKLFKLRICCSEWGSRVLTHSHIEPRNHGILMGIHGIEIWG